MKRSDAMRRLWRRWRSTPPVPYPIYPHVSAGVCMTCGAFVYIEQPVFPEAVGGPFDNRLDWIGASDDETKNLRA